MVGPIGTRTRTAGFTARDAAHTLRSTLNLAAAEGLAPSPSKFRASRPTQLNDTAINGAIARNCIGIFALRVQGLAD